MKARQHIGGEWGREAFRNSGLRVVLIGYGAVNARVVQLLAESDIRVEIVAVATRSGRDVSLARTGLALLRSVEDLADLRPDLVVEAAGREAVATWGEAALRCGAPFVVSSASAFADETLLGRLRSVAAAHGAQLVISPGAVGGIDALAAAARLGLESLTHTIAKPPAAWRGTPAYTESNSGERVIFFSGSAREAADRFPANANVVVVTALASGLGLDRAKVELVSDTALERNRHLIRAEGTFGQMSIDIENRPLAGNPRSSELAALALVRLVENAISDVSI